MDIVDVRDIMAGAHGLVSLFSVAVCLGLLLMASMRLFRESSAGVVASNIQAAIVLYLFARVLWKYDSWWKARVPGTSRISADIPVEVLRGNSL
jgi:hypothetical protein